MRKFSVLIAFALVLRCDCHIGLGSCSLQCDGDGSSASSNELPTRFQGAPGKRGVKGLQGPKGEPGEQCECLEVRELIEEIESIKRASLPISCADVASVRHGVEASGVYTIFPGPDEYAGLPVYCDMTTDGGGWLVIQKRIDGSENFYRNFSEYVRGFGRLNGEFWLGLETMHYMTNSGNFELRIDMEDFDNETRYAHYSTFTVGAETDYALRLGEYNGTAGNSMAHSGRFSAKDFDQDTWFNSCSEAYKGGWWYGSCHAANPNGLYLAGEHTSYADGVNWRSWRGYNYSLKRIEMKIRQK